MNFQWRKVSFSREKSDRLQRELNINPMLCDLLVQRGVQSFEEAKAFFRPKLEDLHNPYLMKDMGKAVKRINQAKSKQEKIFIYGDYDVDGTSAVSMFYSFLKQYYSNIETYIPDRYEEGYGISYEGIDYAAEKQTALIIALDCGIKALKKVEYAKNKGIDFIICDHHLPGTVIPKAMAVLDPKRDDCLYPYKELSGCGIGFKLIQALCKDWNLADKEWHNLLDFLVVSIGADIVHITGENRILAYYGLKKINENPRLAFAQLKELTGKKEKPFTIADIVFLIAPRINAAGRISHGKLVVDLLTTPNKKRVKELSELINDHNLIRQDIDQEITAEVLRLLEEVQDEDRKTTVLFNEKWHKGVIGIVASRLVETHYKPTIIFTESKGKLIGSARSVKNFDIYQALEECSDLLEEFGGHKYAAGITLCKELFETFKNKFEEVVSQCIKPEQLSPEIEINAVIRMEEINWSFWKILKQFAPFGPRNMTPTFQTDMLVNTSYSKRVGKGKDHLRLVLKDPENGKIITGVGFGMADKIRKVQSNRPISVAYHVDENEFNGEISLQMRIKDVKLSEEIL